MSAIGIINHQGILTFSRLKRMLNILVRLSVRVCQVAKVEINSGIYMVMALNLSNTDKSLTCTKSSQVRVGLSSSLKDLHPLIWILPRSLQSGCSRLKPNHTIKAWTELSSKQRLRVRMSQPNLSNSWTKPKHRWWVILRWCWPICHWNQILEVLSIKRWWRITVMRSRIILLVVHSRSTSHLRHQTHFRWPTMALWQACIQLWLAT